MSLAMYVDRALRGKCAICNRKVRSGGISLYWASTVSWEAEHGSEVEADVEVKVCGDECLSLYNAGEGVAS